MTLEAGRQIYKSVDPRFHDEGVEFDTSNYNYGLLLKHGTGRDRADFDRIIGHSKRTGLTFEKCFVQVRNERSFRTLFEMRRFEAAFREHFIDRVRLDTCPTAPRRRESFFGGLEQSHVELYVRSAEPANNKLVTLEVIDCRAAFVGDMNLLDQFELDKHNYEIGQQIVENYWREERTHAPCLELFVQGRLKWGRAIPNLAFK